MVLYVLSRWYSASAPDERLPVDASGSSSLPVMIPVLSLHGIQGILSEVIGFGHGGETITPNINSSRQESLPAC